MTPGNDIPGDLSLALPAASVRQGSHVSATAVSTSTQQSRSRGETEFAPSCDRGGGGDITGISPTPPSAVRNVPSKVGGLSIFRKASRALGFGRGGSTGNKITAGRSSTAAGPTSDDDDRPGDDRTKREVLRVGTGQSTAQLTPVQTSGDGRGGGGGEEGGGIGGAGGGKCSHDK